MSIQRDFALVCYSLVFLQVVQIQSEIIPETKLVTSLFNEYNSISRPIKNPHNNLTVEIALVLLHILEVNEKSHSFTISAWISQTLTDELLQWNPISFDNISALRVPTKNIWYPDIGNYDAIDRGYISFADESKVLIRSNGSILYMPQVILKSRCKMIVTWFPFDEQFCSVSLGSWTYSSREMDLKLTQDVGFVDLPEFTPNGEWDLISNTVELQIFQFDDPYSMAVYTFHIKRKPLYYFFSLIIPSGLIGFLALLGFTLPPQSGEKVTLGVTVLFSLIMFLNGISQTSPSNSDSIPLLGTYFTCVMFMIALSTVSTVFVNLNKRSILGNHQWNISGIWEKLLLKWLPWILGMTPISTSKIIDSSNAIITAKGNQFDKTFGMENIIDEISYRWNYASIVIDKICLIISILFAASLVFVLIFVSK